MILLIIFIRYILHGGVFSFLMNYRVKWLRVIGKNGTILISVEREIFLFIVFFKLKILFFSKLLPDLSRN